ncbi:unnamed protein product, partial [Didymodactylos carnosus]
MKNNHHQTVESPSSIILDNDDKESYINRLVRQWTEPEKRSIISQRQLDKDLIVKQKSSSSSSLQLQENKLTTTNIQGVVYDPFQKYLSEINPLTFDDSTKK